MNLPPRRHRGYLLLAAVGLLASGCGSSHQSAASLPVNGEFRGAPLTGDNQEHGFALRDQNGRLIKLSAQRGHWVLLTFLYTSCTDVCPIIADNLNTVVRLLGDDGSKVQIDAVSVDPTGDTLSAVRHYVQVHRLVPQFHYLIGSRSQLERIWIAYNVVSRNNEAGKLVHSSYTFIVDPTGKLRIVYPPPARADIILRDLGRLMSD